MSVPVELADLAEKTASYGPVAYLVTAGPDGKPHVVSVAPSWEGDRLEAGAGRHTSENIAQNPTATIMWAAPPGQPYCLIVDGQAEVGDSRLLLTPTRAVLHRVAQADEALPSCVTVL
jgi:hypothetical protein